MRTWQVKEDDLLHQAQAAHHQGEEHSRQDHKSCLGECPKILRHPHQDFHRACKVEDAAWDPEDHHSTWAKAGRDTSQCLHILLEDTDPNRDLRSSKVNPRSSPWPCREYLKHHRHLREYLRKHRHKRREWRLDLRQHPKHFHLDKHHNMVDQEELEEPEERPSATSTRTPTLLFWEKTWKLGTAGWRRSRSSSRRPVSTQERDPWATPS